MVLVESVVEIVEIFDLLVAHADDDVAERQPPWRLGDAAQARPRGGTVGDDVEHDDAVNAVPALEPSRRVDLNAEPELLGAPVLDDLRHHALDRGHRNGEPDSGRRPALAVDDGVHPDEAAR